MYTVPDVRPLFHDVSCSLDDRAVRSRTNPTGSMPSSGSRRIHDVAVADADCEEDEDEDEEELP
jgi:hypothetical protein